MTRWSALPALALVVLGVAIGGCGANSVARHRRQAAPAGGPSVPGHPDAFSAAVGVIRGWSEALRRGDVRAAAAYFALPSLFSNGTGAGAQMVATLRTRDQAYAANAALPCGARLLSATPHGRLVRAVFLLTGRSGAGGTDCGGGAGQRASTDFLIRGGKIVAWVRAELPGTPGGAPSSPPGGTAPSPTPAQPGAGGSVSA